MQAMGDDRARMGNPGIGSPGQARMSGDDGELRASDAERDQVATELGEHFQAGRLDQAEFDERLTQALRARTRGDLAVLLRDLPSARRPGTLPHEATPAVADEQGGPPARLAPVLVPLLLVAFIASGALVGGWHHGHAGNGPWPGPLLWVAIIAFIWLRRSRRAGRRPGSWPGGR